MPIGDFIEKKVAVIHAARACVEWLDLDIGVLTFCGGIVVYKVLLVCIMLYYYMLPSSGCSIRTSRPTTVDSMSMSKIKSFTMWIEFSTYYSDLNMLRYAYCVSIRGIAINGVVWDAMVFYISSPTFVLV